VGKGTVIRRLAELEPKVWVSVSATTRPARPGEEHGRDYLFVTEPEFGAMVRAGRFLEHADYAGFRYGTPRGPVEKRVIGPRREVRSSGERGLPASRRR
jgi:guanylate kinase